MEKNILVYNSQYTFLRLRDTFHEVTRVDIRETRFPIPSAMEIERRSRFSSFIIPIQGVQSTRKNR